MALHAVRVRGPVELLELAALEGEALVMPCGLAGSATIAGERLWSGAEGQVLRDRVQALQGASVRALMSFRVAGPDALLAVAWAASLGLPLVDADAMGRGLPTCPVVITDGRGTTLVLETGDEGVGRFTGACAAEMGGCCAIALCCLPAARIAEATVPGAVSRALALGGALAEASDHDRAAAVARALEGRVLLRGRVVELERRAQHGRATASATVAGAEGDQGRRVRLELQSEYLLALEDGAPLAAVPDLICVLTADTGSPIPTELLRRGARVAVVAAPASRLWRSPASAFGYEIPDART
jgi:DUF917 family protein